MKNLRFLIFFIALLLNASVFGQIENEHLAKSAFDFWVGEWEVSWYTKDSSFVKGTNKIVKILDGKVIQESFSDPNTGFMGTSISVYNPQDKSWHQAWADNQGGFINLIGKIDAWKRIFETLPEKSGDKTVIKRMVFYNIEPDRFNWDWEMSTDGGKNWKLKWRIFYKRNK